MDLIIIGIILIVSALAASYARIHRKPTDADTPILLSYYTDSTMVMPLQQGKIGNLHYSAFATINTGGQIENPHTGALLIRVELPFRTKIHLLGIPKNAGSMQLDPVGNGVMEAIELEGDYSNYFHLYADTGADVEARYVLDPKAMLFTTDFCQSQAWELIRDELYFVQTSAGQAAGDPTAVWDDVLLFIAEIKPAVADKDSPMQTILQAPYGQDRRQDLRCALCGSTLENHDVYFSCPKNDGILINGGHLEQLRQGELSIAMMKTLGDVARDHDITCAACGQKMQRVAYNGSSTIIDVCTNCPYRWLDRGEVIMQTKHHSV
jgi:Zn-finger nucleic acid-binding protein